MEWEALRWIMSFLWVLAVPVILARRAEEKSDKKELHQSIKILETELAVLKTTAVTEVGLRDYIAGRFRESDQIHKRELERLEDKLDHLADVINDLAKNLPKRRGESSNGTN